MAWLHSEMELIHKPLTRPALLQKVRATLEGRPRSHAGER